MGRNHLGEVFTRLDRSFPGLHRPNRVRPFRVGTIIGTGGDKPNRLTRLENSLIVSGLIYWLRLCHINVASQSTPKLCPALSRRLVKFEMNSVSILPNHYLLSNLFSPTGQSSLQAFHARNVSPHLLSLIAARISHSSVRSSLKELAVETDESLSLDFMRACGMLLGTLDYLEKLHIFSGDNASLPAPFLLGIPETIRKINIHTLRADGRFGLFRSPRTEGTLAVALSGHPICKLVGRRH